MRDGGGEKKRKRRLALALSTSERPSRHRRRSSPLSLSRERDAHGPSPSKGDGEEALVRGKGAREGEEESEEVERMELRGVERPLDCFLLPAFTPALNRALAFPIPETEAGSRLPIHSRLRGRREGGRARESAGSGMA